MLKGREFGDAIRDAIKLKLERGLAASKAEIARHFEMQPPSLADWVKKGSVSKHRLPEFFRYFSDVAGPAHWGMTEAEWPAGLPITAPHANSKGQPYIVKRFALPQRNDDDESLLLRGYRAAPPDAKKFWLDQARHYLEIQKVFNGRSEQ